MNADKMEAQQAGMGSENRDCVFGRAHERTFTVRSPKAMMPAGTSWIPKGIRQIITPVLM
jgi:hypothetical protein